MNSKVHLLSTLLLITLVGAGCTTLSSHNTPTNANTAANPHADHAMGAGNEMPKGTTLAGSRFKMENANTLKPGNVTLAFTIFGSDGEELKTENLKVVHDKRLHLLLVRDDMTQFQHLHPEYTNNKWTVTTNLPEQGDYQLYVDIAPEKEMPIVLRVPIQVGGATVTKTFPTPNPSQSANDQGVQATLSGNGPFKTGETKQLTFTLTKNNQPIKDVDPYLGAFGHVVLLRHNAPDDFLHVHPITEAKPTDGKVLFETTFTTPGRYTLYAQFSVNGSVKTFPITVDVEETSSAQTPTVSQPGTMDHSGHH